MTHDAFAEIFPEEGEMAFRERVMIATTAVLGSFRSGSATNANSSLLCPGTCPPSGVEA